MSTIKTKIDSEIVYSFVKDIFDQSASNFQFIVGGEMSQAFSFDTSSGSYVIRVNTNPKSFYKDEYAFKHFSSSSIPIPRIIKIDRMDDNYYFAISEKAEGKHVSELPIDQYHAILPELLQICDAIHQVDVSKTVGYGKWDRNGIAEYSSWKEYILGVDFFAQKEDLFKTSFLEKEVWDRVYSQINTLSEFCSEEKYLVHGDYGHNNAVSDGKRITGVFDWGNGSYGDFVYDIAWLSFWNKNPEKVKEIEDYYGAKNIPHFAERLLCYKLRLGLGSLGFYAFSDQKSKYDSIKERTLNLLY